MASERSGEEKEAHWDTRSGVRGQDSQGPESYQGQGKLHFLLSFVLLTVRLDPSVQLRIPARCSKDPAASFSSSSSSGLTSRRGRLLMGHLMAGGRREVCWTALSSQRSESSSLWKPSLPARRDWLRSQPPSSREEREEEEERDEQRCRAALL